MVGAPVSYSGHYPATAPAAGGAYQTQAPPHQMYATPNAPISTLLPYNGSLPPPPHAASFPPSSGPINTTYLYPPTTPAYPPNPSPPTSAPANPYPPAFPNYPPSPAQSLPPPALTGYPSPQPGAHNLHNQAPSGYPYSVQPTGTYPPPPSTGQYYPPPQHSMAQPGIYPGAYPPPRY